MWEIRSFNRPSSVGDDAAGRLSGPLDVEEVPGALRDLQLLEAA
jgi:hypothetical protein